METITKENAKTKSKISALIYANKQKDFHSFTALVEEMLDKYANLEQTKPIKRNVWIIDFYGSKNHFVWNFDFIPRVGERVFVGELIKEVCSINYKLILNDSHGESDSYHCDIYIGVINA